MKAPAPPAVLNQTRSQRSVPANALAGSAFMLVSDVSPSSTLNSPLATVNCTALVGAAPPTEVPSLDQWLVGVASMIANLK